MPLSRRALLGTGVALAAMGDLAAAGAGAAPLASGPQTARKWTQRLEWAIHQPIALKAGLGPEAAAAVAEGRRPAPLDEGEQLVHDLVTELLEHQSVSDPTYQASVRRFGEQGTVDLVAVCGYYTFLALVLNTARTAVPKDATATLQPFICAG